MERIGRSGRKNSLSSSLASSLAFGGYIKYFSMLASRTSRTRAVSEAAYSCCRALGLFFFALLFWLAFLDQSHAEVRVEATVDRSEVGKGDSLRLTVRIASDEGLEIEGSPSLSGLQGFAVSAPSQSSEFRSTIINGESHTERVKKYTYYMTAQKKGQFRIPKIEVAVNGKTYKTEPIDIAVVDAGQAPAPRRQQRGFNPFLDDSDDLFSQLLQRHRPFGNDKNVGPIDPEKAFFIRAFADRKDVYKGEQVTVSFYLYTQGHIRDIDTLKYPSLVGFLREDIHVATSLNFKREVINGVAYKKALLASYALFPIKTGRLEIDPYRAKCTVILPSRTFGFGRPRVDTKESQKIAINVKALPALGQPQGFSGAVGQFKMDSRLDEDKIVVHQPFSYKIRLEGRGNAKTVELPDIEFPPELELYDTSTEAKFFRNGDSYKEFELLLIPRQSGEIEIPEVSISFFNPETEKYEVRKVAKRIIRAEKGKRGKEKVNSLPLAQLHEQDPPDDEAENGFPSLVASWRPSSSASQKARYGLWALMFAGSLALVGLKYGKEVGWGRQGVSIEHEVKNRIRPLYGYIEQGQWRKVGVEMTNVLYLALGELSGQGGANEELEKLLLKAPPSLRRRFGDELQKIVVKFQTVGFAPEELVGPWKEKDVLKKSVKEAEKVILRSISLAKSLS